MRCLLVEDERQVMESMAEFVPWKELGFAAPLMAANGLEALKILETNRADLIVSDVRMPRMNGVELLKTLRERGDETPFLFISGFSDKEYLMAAIRYHAVDYLEKPVMAQELAERIRAVAESLRIPRRYVSVRELLRPGAKAPALLENAACYWVAVLLLAADGLRLTSQQVAGTVRAFYKWAILEEESPERTLLVFAGHGELLPFQSLVDALNRAGGGYALCLSSPVSSIEALPEAYRQADRCTQRAYMRPLRGLQRYADPSAACGALLSRTVEEIRALREKRLFPLIGPVVQRYLERLASLPEAGREEVLQGMQGIAAQMEGLEMEGLELCADFAAASAEFSRRVVRCAREMLEKAVGFPVSRAIHYIMENFAQPVSVPEIARAAFVSASHLSYLFRQSLDCSIKQYATQLRMEAARLLLSSGRTVQEAANLVGLPDVAYFSKLFKREVGVSPASLSGGGGRNA